MKIRDWALAILLVAWLALTVGVTTAHGQETKDGRVKAYACPPGAPPNSTLCSPAGWLILAEWAEMEGASVAAPAAVATSTSLGVTVGAGINLLAGGVLLSVGGVFDASIIVEDLETGHWGTLLPPPAPALEAGWVNGDNLVTFTKSGQPSFTAEIHVIQPLTYGATTGSLWITREIVSGSCPAGGVTGWSPNAMKLYSTTGTVLFTLSLAQWFNSNCTDIGNNTHGVLNPASPGFASFKEAGTTQYEWRPAGYPGGQPPEVPGTLDRNVDLEVKYDCINAAGTIAHETITSTRTVTLGRTELPLPDYACELGQALVGFGIKAGPEGGTLEDLVPWTTTPEFVQSIPQEVPECLTEAGCHQSLWKWDVPQQAWVSCGQAAVGCQGWATDPSRVEHYQCRLGSVVVALDICSPLRRPGSVLPSITTTTETGPNGEAVVELAPLPDPATPPSDPAWQYPEDPGGETDPLTPYTDGGTAQECFPTGWGLLNPFEWVYKPVRCVFIWAFVPRGEVLQAAGDEVKEAIKAHGVLGVLADMADIPTAVAAGWNGTCEGLGDFAYPVEGQTETLGLPCTPEEAFIGGPTGVYDVIYQIVNVLLLATAGWAGFLMVRQHFGGKS